MTLSLDQLTESLLQYFPDNAEQSPTIHDPPVSKEMALLDRVQGLLDHVRDTHHENLVQLKRINDLLDRLSTAQALLQQTLNQATSGLPTLRRNLSTAECDHISAMIETSLVRISLLRARACNSLYGAGSFTQSQPGHQVSSVIGNAFRVFKADEMRIQEEERVLDHHLCGYHHLLAVVDAPGGGGFRQIVDDWTRVRKETEECRKDLRRLGWSGD